MAPHSCAKQTPPALALKRKVKPAEPEHWQQRHAGFSFAHILTLITVTGQHSSMQAGCAAQHSMHQLRSHNTNKHATPCGSQIVLCSTLTAPRYNITAGRHCQQKASKEAQAARAAPHANVVQSKKVGPTYKRPHMVPMLTLLHHSDAVHKWQAPVQPGMHASVQPNSVSDAAARQVQLLDNLPTTVGTATTMPC